jgi:predicted dehydrogenase
MQQGQDYAPVMAPTKPVCAPGEFVIAAAFADHGHLFGMVSNLIAAGATLGYVYEPDDAKANKLLALDPAAKRVAAFDVILQVPEVRLVAAAAIPNLRAGIGIEVLQADKDYFTDKCPFTTLDQLEGVRQVVAATGRKYAVCYSERVQNEAAEHARFLIEQGAIGRVLQVIGLGPHRLSASLRPDWFFNKEAYGGILCDLGSHQVELFLTYTGNQDAAITLARVANLANPAHPELEDFGEYALVGDNAASAYCRVDWFTPGGLRTWGDGRTLITGTQGMIECRKYVDLANPELIENTVLLVNDAGEHRQSVTGQVGYPFFAALILDCLNGTEHAMTQAHAFKAAELSLAAQAMADGARV